MQTQNDIYTQSVRYLKQTGEIYGDELYLKEPKPVYQTSIPKTHTISFDDLKKSIQECEKCSLSQSRRHTVFGSGNKKARLMLIGEAPGNEEDLKGLPFVGEAGHLLDKILAAIDFKREEVFIANILKCRPPRNRDPEPDEVRSCYPYLKLQIEHIAPKMILTLGRVAAQTLLGTSKTIQSMRGQVHHYTTIPVMVTYHPAALLRNQEWKKPVWQDMQSLRKYYDEHIGDKPAWQPPKRP